MDDRIDGWMVGWMDGWMEGWERVSMIEGAMMGRIIYCVQDITIMLDGN